MTTTVLWQVRSSGGVASGEARDLPDGTTIVEVTPFSRMSEGELVGIIRSARLPLPREVDQHLEFCDRPTLVRLAHLARRCCHNRQSALPMDHPVDERGA